MNATLTSVILQHGEPNIVSGYIIGGLLTLLILGYLLYSLIRPEKF